MTSIVQTLNPQNVESTFIERAVQNLAEKAFRDLLRQLRQNQITPKRASQVWKVKRGCYDCCMKAVREGKMP